MVALAACGFALHAVEAATSREAHVMGAAIIC